MPSHHFTRTLGGATSVYEIRTVAAAPGSSQPCYRPVTARPADTRWDEAEVYTGLAQHPPMTAYRVAQLIGKPAANVYKAVESL